MCSSDLVDEPGAAADQAALGVAQRGVDHQVHRQAAVRDEGGVAFLAARVVAVVVDAVGVPGDRRVAEVQRVGEVGALAPRVGLVDVDDLRPGPAVADALAALRARGDDEEDPERIGRDPRQQIDRSREGALRRSGRRERIAAAALSFDRAATAKDLTATLGA